MVVALVAACGGRLPDRATEFPDLPDLLDTPAPAEPGSTAAPTPAIEPLDVPFEGTFPASAEFVGARFTVTSATITNIHPYPMFGDPPPGEQTYGILTVEAENTGSSTIDYGFDDESFALMTWSGAELPVVHRPGLRPFYRLVAAQRETDDVVFGLPDVEALDGAALLIGRAPDARAVIPLTGPTGAPRFPAALAALDPVPVHAGSLDWSVTSGAASLDAPAAVCCSETGARADDDEFFVTLSMRATVNGSPYGQASISTDLLRLLADGVPLEPLVFDGRANVGEGETYELDVHWLAPEAATDLAVQLEGGTASPVTLQIGFVTPP
jgi:hypothetical protein